MTNIEDPSARIRQDPSYKAALEVARTVCTRPLVYQIVRSGRPDDSSLRIDFLGLDKPRGGKWPDIGWIILSSHILLRGAPAVKLFLTTSNKLACSNLLDWRALGPKLGVQASRVVLTFIDDLDQIPALDALVQTILDKYVELNVPDPTRKVMEPDMED